MLLRSADLTGSVNGFTNHFKGSEPS